MVRQASSPAKPTRGHTTRKPSSTHSDGKTADVRDEVEKADEERRQAVDRWQRHYEEWLNQQSDKRGHGDNPPVTPFLLIRYALNDLGIRPIPSGTPFWVSPDIWVESSDPGGNPVAGEPNYVHVRIFNLGAFQAAPVQVDFYWANPSLGLSPATMNMIGTEWVNLPSLGSVDVRCNTAWVPVIVNGGHECVMVNCSNWILDPIVHPFQPTLDRHVGQRNLHVVPGKAGMKIQFNLQLTNTFPMTLPVTVTTRFDRLQMTGAGRDVPLQQIGAIAAGFRAQERTSAVQVTASLLRDTPAHRVAQRSLALARRATEGRPGFFHRSADRTRSGQILANLREGYGVVDQPLSGKFAGEQLAALDLFTKASEMLEGERVLLKDVVLDAFTFRTLEVEFEVPADAQEGEFLVTHLAQHAGPITLGGYAIVVHVGA